MNDTPHTHIETKPLIPPKTMTCARDIDGSDTLLGALKLFFQFATPRTIALKILVTLGIRCWIGDWTTTDLLIVAAILVYWPMQEWFFHMNLLHAKPRRFLGWTIDLGPSRAHRFHHRNPAVLETTFVPLKAILILIPVNVAFWSLLMSTWAVAFTGICFFSMAALMYEWVHYLTHTNYKPKTKYVQRIFRNHRLHHFKHEAYWHAFTVPFVDTVFGTNPDPTTVKKSKTVRTLGVEL